MKSNVSDHLEFIHNVYIDACMKCIADVSDLRDLETIRSRVEDEGISFLTITLPQFCKDFERSLSIGYIDSKCFREFRKYRSIPAFLRGMISQIFDCETGRINDDNVHSDSSDTPTIVESIRQICLTFKKLEMDCTPAREASALENYIAIERSFEMFSLSPEDTDRFKSVSFVLWSDLLRTIGTQHFVPKHGPGKTADRISGNQKYRWQRWHERLEPYFPLIGYAYPLGIAPFLEELEEVTLVPQDMEQPVKVTPVPKTLKGPRIIAIEPCCMQYAQQGILSVLVDALESHWLTAGHVNFRDQTINQRLAVIGSSTGQLATIDLSDASDRVPHDLAMEMFSTNPDLQDSIESCRTTKAQMPDGSIIGPLRKFASMGSALCFPVEAMYFYTICVVALLEAQNLPVSRENCFLVSRDIHVFGDDLIVPTTYAIAVLDYLRKYNCKVNTNKTFVSGSFRESCGIDAYMGYEVTPQYLHHERPKNRQESDKIISWVASSNLFYKKGYWRTARFMQSCIERLIGPLPYLPEDSSGLGKFTFLGMRSSLTLERLKSLKNVRWNKYLHRFEVKAMVAGPIYHTDKLDGFPALMKSFLNLEKLKNSPGYKVAGHLERSALRDAVALTRRWVPAT